MNYRRYVLPSAPKWQREPELRRVLCPGGNWAGITPRGVSFPGLLFHGSFEAEGGHKYITREIGGKLEKK
jgi:hypothetical protein